MKRIDVPRPSNLMTARPRAELRQGRTDWYTIKNHDTSNSARIDIYSEIGYWGVTAQDFINELNQLEVDEIDLHLATPGGEVWDGIAIYNALIDHPAKVTATVDSHALSCGSLILQAGDHRIMNRNSETMIHRAIGFAIGNDDVMEEARDLLKKCSANIASIYEDRSGVSAEQWLEAMRKETWYSAKEAVDAGLADEYVTGNKDGDRVDNSFDLSIFNYSGRRNAPAPHIEQPKKASTLPFDLSSLNNVIREALA
jgi:ATP-dependent protease ClpP protease subunit